MALKRLVKVVTLLFVLSAVLYTCLLWSRSLTQSDRPLLIELEREMADTSKPTKTFTHHFLRTESFSRDLNYKHSSRKHVNSQFDEQHTHSRTKQVADSRKMVPLMEHAHTRDHNNITTKLQSKTMLLSDSRENNLRAYLLPPSSWESNTKAYLSLDDNCSDTLCSQYLSNKERQNFNMCLLRTQRKLNHQQVKKSLKELKNLSMTLRLNLTSDPLTSGGCRFINGRGRGVVGLVSFPGSGNTWVRELLQSITGVCTGSVYCDGILRSSGFDGEGVQSSSVLVVKQHTPSPKWTDIKNVPQYDQKNRPHYDKVILIVRNPFHALVSEWNRELSTKHGLGSKNSSHTNSFGAQYFGTFARWGKFVEDRVVKWVKGFSWLTEHPPDREVMLVRYEDLRSQLVPELARMLHFLSFHITETQISERLKLGQFSFHRKSTRNFNPFTPNQEQLVTKAIDSVIDSLQNACSNTFHIEEYLNN